MQVPSELLHVQKWFAKTITWPINQENPYFSEAPQFITANKDLDPGQRIQIYNQQYWWRLLSAMQENFPTLAAIFGYEDFNLSLAIPFLKDHPSSSWSLNKLGEKFPHWIDVNYLAKDKPLVFYSALIDEAYTRLFLAPFPKPFIPSLDQRIALQKHVHPYKLPFDIFTFRKNLLAKPADYWLENDFPLLRKGRDYYFLLYRNGKHQISYREIEKEQWLLINLIESEGSIEKGCDALEELGLTTVAEKNLPRWIQEWIRDQFWRFYELD